MSDAVSKLNLSEKIGYAFGDAGCNLYWKTFEFFLLFFYTDVFGLPPAAAGTMFAVARIFDALCDPIMGLVADRTQTRWGKFRPYLLWLALPNAIAAVLTFTVPSFGEHAKLVYAYFTYTGMMVMFTAINIPYSALMGVMTSDNEERTRLSAFRYVGAFSAGLIVVCLTKRLVVLLGGGNAAWGWQLTMLIWSTLATVLFILCWAATRERLRPPELESSNAIAELRDLSRNGPWFVLFALSVVIMTTFWIRSAASLYYYKYFLHRDDLFEVFSVSCSIAMIAGIGLTSALSRLLHGKKWAYITVMGSSSTLVLFYYIIPPEKTGMIFALSVLISFILGPQSPLLFAMYADTVDYSEWKTGRRSTGLIFAASTFALKVGSAFAGWITGVLLDHFGYAANQSQTPSALEGIRILSSIVPGLIGLAAAAVLLLYRLDDRIMKKVSLELAQRRSEVPASVS